MGMICSKGHPVAQAEDEVKARELDRRINQEQRDERNVHKLLLLGAGESGKSTIFKQIRVLYDTGFNELELKHHASVIHANVFQFIKILYEGCRELSKKYPDESDKYVPAPSTAELATQLVELDETVGQYPELDEQWANIIEAMWKDPAIQAARQRANELQLPESIEYFIKDLPRLAQPGYIPTKEDVLHARVRTTGISDIEFRHDRHVYRLFDVGGQRSERRKWIHVFDGVKAVIFCAALSEYDQNLFEDETKNRMMETKELFEWVLKQPTFKTTAFMVFLNKYDIFQKKVLSVPLNVCQWFEDYQAPPTEDRPHRVEHAYKYVERKFEEIYRKNTPGLGNERLCRFYKTTALDPNLMKATFQLVDKALLLENMETIDGL